MAGPMRSGCFVFVVILGAAKDLLVQFEKQALRCAQGDTTSSDAPAWARLDAPR